MSDYRSGGKLHGKRTGKMKVTRVTVNKDTGETTQGSSRQVRTSKISKAEFDSGGSKAANEAIKKSKATREKIKLKPPEKGGKPKRIK